jgi:hypothetical protein
MPTKEDQRSRSATWWDVKVYCLEVGKAHNGYVSIIASPNVPERVGKAFSWTVAWWPQNRPVSTGYLIGVSEQYPHVDHAAVTDLLMKMIFNLDWKLTEREHTAERQASF